MKDTALAVAHDARAPADERQDAMTQLTKSVMPQVIEEHIHAEKLKPLLDFISHQQEEQEFSKSLRRNVVIPFPSYAARHRNPGMQSVVLDDIQIGVMGDYYERPGVFSFDSMRQMVAGTPILNAVIMQRIRQVQRFCRPQKSGKGPGFRIAPRDKDEHIDEDEKKSMKLLESFFSNSGWETNPRQRRRLKRDDMSTFMAKLVRDSLTMDSCPIETEFKRDRKLGIDGIYAVDGSTIRLATEEGYRGDDEIFAIQLVQGQIRSAYTYEDLIYVPRNPRTDVLAGGYGMAETELLVQTVTGFLNAFSYNTKFFDSNAIPKGILNLYGSYSDADIGAFKRYWNGMVKGINNAWSMPVMISKDQESKAQFESFGDGADEMMFARWMTFLGSLICAIYGMAPDEINFESFSAGSSSLSGNDTEEKLASSKDKGLRPLLSYFENMFTDYIVGEFSDKYEFRWTGLDEEDEKTVFERKKLIMTVNEMRAEDGMEATDGDWGDAPLNSSLIAVWQAENQAQNEDYGQPGMGAPGGGAPADGEGGDDFGATDPEADAGAAPGAASGADFGGGEEDGEGSGAGGGQPADLAKSFGLPILRIEP